MYELDLQSQRLGSHPGLMIFAQLYSLFRPSKPFLDDHMHSEDNAANSQKAQVYCALIASCSTRKASGPFFSKSNFQSFSASGKSSLDLGLTRIRSLSWPLDLLRSICCTILGVTAQGVSLCSFAYFSVICRRIQSVTSPPDHVCVIAGKPGPVCNTRIWAFDARLRGLVADQKRIGSLHSSMGLGI